MNFPVFWSFTPRWPSASVLGSTTASAVAMTAIAMAAGGPKPQVPLGEMIAIDERLGYADPAHAGT